MRLALPKIIGAYRVLELLGQGGMGNVYLAEPLGGGDRVALKTVKVSRESLLPGIRREIWALARLRHTGVVRILDHGIFDGLPWYAMEWIDARTLRQVALGPPYSTTPAAAEAGRGRSRSSEAKGESSAEREFQNGPGSDASTLVVGPAATEAAAPEVFPQDETALLNPAMTHFAVHEALPERGAGPGHDVDASVSFRRVATNNPASHKLSSARLESILSLIRRICPPLAYLHGEGIVHRDLKPENVLIRSDGEPVIIDFGLMLFFAAGLSRETLFVDPGIAGTAPYMAPEQISGQPVDARADLYALGCILYEMLTGRTPFRGTTDQVLQAHLFQPPPPPSGLVEGLPPQVEELLLRLLAKEPRQRFGHAADVAARLEALGARQVRPDAAPPPRSYLYRPGFAGRSEDLQRFMQRLQELRAGRGGLLFVGGESGVGKTRFALEAARAATERGVYVLAGECLPTGFGQETPMPANESRGPAGGSTLGTSTASVGQPLQALRRPLQTIADRCRERGVAETDRILGPRGKLLAHYEPALRDLPGQHTYPEPPELPPEEARNRLLKTLAETLAALCASGERRWLRVLLILDDLHWADDLTLGLLEHLACGPIAGHPLIVLGTYRTAEASDVLRKLVERTEHENLGRLDDSSIGAMVADMLALPQPPAMFVHFLARHSEGNPFFVAEYLRTAVASSLLWRDEHGRWLVEAGEARIETYEALPLPRSIRDLVSHHLELLSPMTKTVVEAASVIGREIDLPVLSAMSGLDEESLAVALHELTTRQVLRAHGPETVRFVHDKLREVAYEQIGSGQRPDLHRAAATTIESLDVTRRRQFQGVLGRHWEAAGEIDRGRASYLLAARALREQYAHDEAEKLYRAGLRLDREPNRESVIARNEFGEKLLLLRGRPAEAGTEHQHALEDARRLGDLRLEAECLRLLARVHLHMGRVEEARRFYEQALAMTHAVGSRAFEGQLALNLASLERAQGRPEAAREFAERALSIHRELRDARSAGIILGDLAILHMEQGRMAKALQYYEEALAIHREVGDRMSEGIALGNLANLHTEQGRMEDARHLYEQALAIHREVGDRRSEGIVLGNLASLHNEQGRMEEARQLSEQALAIHRETGSRQLEGSVLGNLARIYKEQGRMEEAQTLFLEALAIHRQVGNRLFEGIVLGELADFELFRTNDPSRAGALAEQAESILELLGDKLALGKLLSCRGHIALASGQDGRGLLHRAQALASDLSAGLDSELDKAIRRLRSAVEASEAGQSERLFRGHLPEDLPEGIRSWLSNSGQHARQTLRTMT